MKVETQDLPDSQVELSFEIEDARVERAMDAAYKRLAGKVNISGFRRGKAPRALVERVLGREALLEEALNHLLPEVFDEAVSESNVKALTDPQFSVESISPLKAKATVVVPPPVELGDYRAIAHAIPEAEVKDEEIEAVLDQLREAHAQWVPVERAAAIGDRLTMDVEGRAENERVFNQENVDFVLEAGSPNPMPGFAEALVGIQAGETREFELAEEMPEGDLPEGAEPPTPRTMTFIVTAQDVKEKELPELDDEFAAGLGSYQDLADLRSRVERQLRERTESTTRMDAQQKVLEEAISSATVALPPRLVEHQTHRLRDRFARQLDSGGFSIEQYLRARHTSSEEFEAELAADAERGLKRSLVLQEIAKREGMSVTDEEVDTGIREAFASEDAQERVITQALKLPDLRERVRTQLLEERAAAWLVEHATGAAPASDASGDATVSSESDASGELAAGSESDASGDATPTDEAPAEAAASEEGQGEKDAG
jgi:trigger factor